VHENAFDQKCFWTAREIRPFLAADRLIVPVVIGRAKRYIVNVISRFAFLFYPVLFRKTSLLCALLLLSRSAGIASVLAGRGAGAAEMANVSRDARKILSDNCFKCHGPDEKERKGGKKGARLRLDTPEGAQMDLGGHQAVVPGHPEKSEMVKRITSTDADEKMPPPESGKKLTPTDIALLQNWIKQGAAYTKHWAYIKPVRPALPKVKNQRGAKNDIDFFIMDRLDREKLKPSQEADRATLIRRASLDLTGLPPTPEEVNEFVKDRKENAYGRMIDRMLAKQSYGEHWARWWLDQARYADSAGYADDPARTIWAYRDYVIRAFNSNMPFDEFTIEQLAGDLLPDPNEDQVIATGFHRNTMTNNEGGTSDEEFRNVAIVDRVNTTMSVWMGTTMGCAQCHTHKYDPITNEDYFRMFAILNNTEDADRTDEAPVYTIWTKQQKEERAKLEKEIAPLEKAVTTWTPELKADEKQWETALKARLQWEPLTISLPRQRTPEFAPTPERILNALKFAKPYADEEVSNYYLTIAPNLKTERRELAALKKEFDDIKPMTTVPVLRELVSDKRRNTRMQMRGNYLVLGKEVSEGLPPALGPAQTEGPVTRMTLAKWLVSPDNPLTARVIVNRLWESIFGIGLVRTSEDFGAQGEAPSHPELLDYLATEFMREGWDVKHMLKLMVTSAAYRQSSRVTPELLAKDPDNRLLARGPRFRLSAETIRDQAMFVSGLLSPKMYGPPVKPPQPKMGLSAAFGSATDWETSAGEDRYRRAIYTTWRRSNPYPSMATFDAPNREVCTVRRDRSNTPLQALVTMNDPVYVEAAQALARRMILAGSNDEDKLQRGFELCVAREPSKAETEKLLALYEKARLRFAYAPQDAFNVATKPIGPAPKDVDLADLAAWSVIGNVLLNLDETLMKR
jgi:hypothetical protein